MPAQCSPLRRSRSPGGCERARSSAIVGFEFAVESGADIAPLCPRPRPGIVRPRRRPLRRRSAHGTRTRAIGDVVGRLCSRTEAASNWFGVGLFVGFATPAGRVVLPNPFDDDRETRRGDSAEHP